MKYAALGIGVLLLSIILVQAIDIHILRSTVQIQADTLRLVRESRAASEQELAVDERLLDKYREYERLSRQRISQLEIGCR